MDKENMNTPRHVGYIMDGNRRWAKSHGLPAYEGHLAGYNALKDILRASFDQGVEYVSIYAFSTENWKRSEDEVSKLMKLMLKIFSSDINEFIQDNIRLRVIGRKEGLSDEMVKAIHVAEEKTAHCTRGTVVTCFNYGGQFEIVDAVRSLIDKGTKSNAVTIDSISENIYGPDIPPVDMVVRVGGEKRLSNFMLWRSTYSELLFLDKLWPDMEAKDVTNIIKEYGKRQRRFGS